MKEMNHRRVRVVGTMEMFLVRVVAMRKRERGAFQLECSRSSLSKPI